MRYAIGNLLLKAALCVAESAVLANKENSVTQLR